MHKLFTFSIFLILGTELFSQIKPYGFCGTSPEDQLIIRDRMFQNREKMDKLVQVRTGAIRYIPVNYHLAANTDGTGRMRIVNVYTNLCAINKLFEAHEIQFYLRNINFINNTALYDDPSSALGTAWCNSLANNNRNAVNIICARVANKPEPGVLAFYNPGGDYIVSGIGSVNANGTTLAHEIGHFFSLAHTFYGWESTTYSCNTPTPLTVFIGGQSVQVEYVNRDKRINGQLVCKIAADGFCDTPADYNLGFGWNGGCVYSGCAVDPDGDTLDPDERNMMSYFLSCLQTFTTEQVAAINRDYNGNHRNYLKAAFTPQNVVPSEINIISPIDQSVTEGFNIVKFQWEPVPNATHYLVEYGETSLTNKNVSFITKRTDTTLTNLVSNKRYAYRVFAYNNTHFCHAIMNPISFVTGKFSVSTKDITTSIQSINWYQVSELELEFNVNSINAVSSNIELFNMQGKKVFSQYLNLQTGANQISINFPVKGTYLYRVSSTSGALSGKCLIL
ncbi:MAG: T9SS type A sorting domain-containing protein [Saprospiraceae bacterium]|nr:T9SS type A sorting domain-containing protein [Saprospiraceae bacterium]